MSPLTMASSCSSSPRMLFSSLHSKPPRPPYELRVLSPPGSGRSFNPLHSRGMMASRSSPRSPPHRRLIHSLPCLHGNNCKFRLFHSCCTDCQLLLPLTLSLSSPSDSAVLLVDTPRNSLLLLSADGFTSLSLSLEGDSSQSAILWPRSLVVSGHDSESASLDSLVLYLGEIFGKIWRVNLNLTTIYEREMQRGKDPIPPLSDCLSPDPSLVVDSSDFDASVTVRGLVSKTRQGMSRAELMYPDILD
jgi:hypothetical protein